MFLPGNWHYEALDRTVRADDGRIVAECVGPADGALIAVAPEMYDVLEERRRRSENESRHARLLARAIGALR